MTKASKKEHALYTIRFIETAGYKITLKARSEQHAITLAKRRWYHGDTRKFTQCSGETEGWDAYRD